MLYLYDTESREKKLFTTISHDCVKMYVCGPTVYDFAHIGNARPVVVFDVLYRLLKHYYKKVIYARNFTDIDDKIIQRLNGQPLEEYTQKYIDAFHEDMDALETLRPDHEPKATEYVEGMIGMIQGLIDKEFAYHRDGHVLFRVKQYKNYGGLSKMSQDELEAGARVEIAPYKENPSDFVLWKPSTDDIPGWDSPWGRGRPGWHIECSVMSSVLLGAKFDIHGGGIDLIFPHHENECAQSCCFHGTDRLANFWMHNGHLTVSGEKMSKSLGNFRIVRDLLKEYKGETIRFAFLMTHYRQPMDFSKESLNAAQKNLNKIYVLLKDFESVQTGLPDPEFLNAINDDLNTPLALSVIYQRLSELHTTPDPEKVAALKGALQILGIGHYAIKEWFQNTTLNTDEIEDLIQQRNTARLNKNYSESDRIRQYLLDQGIILEDLANQTTWRTI